jgi:Holliday junction resolvase
MNFEDIKNHEDLQKVSKEVVWQNFERLTAFIFEENNFQVETGKVKTSNKKRRQYDVIAKVKGKTFLVECKKMGRQPLQVIGIKKRS